ncbi:hypothetical protein Cni_G08054 [Canna indica]|uniref:Uncharacterized protein n=1 Tax=Canna indica TaxID=4628 RepID=A0AAQ3JZZ5_9LILI|nr:hypothetical protein Cni_G08054 [Canna indica]
MADDLSLHLTNLDEVQNFNLDLFWIHQAAGPVVGCSIKSNYSSIFWFSGFLKFGEGYGGGQRDLVGYLLEELEIDGGESLHCA